MAMVLQNLADHKQRLGQAKAGRHILQRIGWKATESVERDQLAVEWLEAIPTIASQSPRTWRAQAVVVPFLVAHVHDHVGDWPRKGVAFWLKHWLSTGCAGRVRGSFHKRPPKR